MKRLSHTLTLALLFAGAIFSSCKKPPCESCPIDPQTGNNKPPIAFAGTDQTVTLPTDSILLDGSASIDPDGNIMTWQWTKISGPSSFTVINPTNSKTRVNNLSEGIYLFELKVTDNEGLSSSATVQITVMALLFNPNGNNVYIAGWGKHSNGKTIARIWKNTSLQDLSNGQFDAGAYSVTISDNNVYVAGYDGGKAILWKNGVAQDLGNGGAFSVFVSGSDVYVAGQSDTTATLWKNGVPQNFGNGVARSVFVSGNDVYVAGILNGAGALWKNGVVQGGPSSEYEWLNLTSVFVSGNDVYVTGTLENYGPIPFLVKNGVSEVLNGARANSVFVSGNDVYVGGMGMSGGATIWKNGGPINLTNGQPNTIANAVFVSGDRMYATGGKFPNTGNESSLWIDGLEYTITGFAQANSLFVQ